MNLKEKLAIFIENSVTQQHISRVSGVNWQSIRSYLVGKTELHLASKKAIEQALIEIAENLFRAVQQ